MGRDIDVQENHWISWTTLQPRVAQQTGYESGGNLPLGMNLSRTPQGLSMLLTVHLSLIPLSLHTHSRNK